MKGYHVFGMQLRLKRAEAGLRQKTLGTLLGGATQALISWWESGRYMPGDRYLSRINQFLSLDPMALRVYVRATGLQAPRRHQHKIKSPFGGLKTDQNVGRLSSFPSSTRGEKNGQTRQRTQI
jgi:transcriptional regulator with XRE-family HTH domain